MSDHTSCDSVAAVIREDQVHRVLAMIHRLGHGHHARLIRAEAGNLAGRIERSGVPADLNRLAISRDDLAVLIVDAPHQSIQVAEFLLGLGALRVERFRPSTAPSVLIAFDPARLERRPSRHRSLAVPLTSIGHLEMSPELPAD